MNVGESNLIKALLNHKNRIIKVKELRKNFEILYYNLNKIQINLNFFNICNTSSGTEI